MTIMNAGGDSYDLDDLLGAYALDAVDPDEARRVEDYLRINPRAAAEVQEHREVATMLAFTGMDAPDDLWARITDQIDSEAPAPGPELAKVLAFEPPVAESVVAPPTSVVTPMKSARRTASTWLMGAAAALALVFGAVAVIGARDATSMDPIADAYAAAVADRDSVQTELVADGSDASAAGVIDQDGHGYLDASALPTLSSDQTYQLWGVLADNGDVVSLGILGPNPELETFTVEGGVAALAVTIEQAPGVISDGNPEGAFVGAFG
ncbi:MAG: anti-sigma factor [Ilumatobacter sp.]